MSDLIKREDAIKALAEVLYEEPPYLNSMEKIEAFAEKELSRIPSVEPKQGEWERIPYSMADYGRRCSLCHFKVGNPTNFCPNCGCRMKGAD